MSDSKPPSAPPDSPLDTNGHEAPVAPKIPSQPVLSVGTPSRPPPSQAFASAPVMPSAPPRVAMPSAPIINDFEDPTALLVTTPSPGAVAIAVASPATTPSPPPSDPPSDPARLRQDSQPPGRKLAPPPKPRRDSSPISEAPPEAQQLPLPPLPPLQTPSFAPPVAAPLPPVASVPPKPVAAPPRPASGTAQAAVAPPAAAVPQILPPGAAAASSPPPANVAPLLSPLPPSGAVVPGATVAQAVVSMPLAASVPPAMLPISVPPAAVSISGMPEPASGAGLAVPALASPPAPAPAKVTAPPPPPPSSLATTASLSPAAGPPPPPTRSLEPPPLRAAEGPANTPRSSPPPPPSPAFAAPPPMPAAGAVPTDFGLEAGGAARVTPPLRQTRPPPRSSEPPPPAHVMPADVAPLASKPTPAPAIQVMRIIAIGNPKAKPAPEVHDDDVEEIADDHEFDDATTPLVNLEVAASLGEPVVEAEAGPDEIPVTTELDDADLAPDSQEGKKQQAAAEEPVTELDRDDAQSIPPPVIDAVEQAPVSEGKPPPPPPRRPQPPKRPDTGRPRARRALKRPWWEELFGEDFSRAVPRLTEKQVTREVDFIEESLGVAKGGVVLDLGCGSGHHAVELASRGYGVVGYDLSVYQLALAADVAQERDQRINFLQGDMREMAFEAMFDGIYCWNTSFGFFEEDKNIAVAERVFRALKPGGMFLLDMANRDFAAAYSPSQLWYEGDSCVCMDDMNIDFITSRLRVKRSVIFDDGRSRECVYSIRLYSLHELGKLLHDVGFRVTEASGQTATPGVFFGEHSPRLIVLAQKP